MILLANVMAVHRQLKLHQPLRNLPSQVDMQPTKVGAPYMAMQRLPRF